MTTVLSEDGKIVLPTSIRDDLHLKAGDDFDVFADDDGTITLRRRNGVRTRDFVDILFSCPEPLEIPPRERDLPPPPFEFDAD